MRVLTMFCSLVMILLSQHAKAAEPPLSPGIDSALPLDHVIEQQMKQSGVVGVGAAIIVNKSVVWSRGYGLADRETGAPFTVDTIMNAGSIAKTFTAWP